MLSLTLISSFSSDLRTVDVLSTLPLVFVSSILAFFGMVVVLDRVGDAIGDMIVAASSFGSETCVAFCCLVPCRVRDEIGSPIG